ncbi:MAG: flavodoxin family protein [Tannerella sp.]|jgi:multimeric flavodoxin WrbA|nr:flavodoxin family protein [Tannerella sp.]
MEQKKNILVITGSPRRGGNSSLLADAFIRGAEDMGHMITRFNAGHKQIKGCTACNKCYSKDTACVFKDDFNGLAPALESAELVAFITPLYWFTFPTQIKAAIDKMYALGIGGRNLKGKETMLLVCAETDDMTDFDGIVRSYELTNRYLKWADKGILLVPEVNNAGDILNTDALIKAEQMGSR